MKQFISKICVCFLLIGIYSQSPAMPPKPDRCPATADIKATGLSFADQDDDGFVVFQLSNYGTNNFWAFAIADIQAGSTQEALALGYTALGSLYGSPYPMAIPSEDLWACVYFNNSGLLSFAITPLPMGAKIAKTMKLHFR